jgi:hypothetical protein
MTTARSGESSIRTEIFGRTLSKLSRSSTSKLSVDEKDLILRYDGFEPTPENSVTTLYIQTQLAVPLFLTCNGSSWESYTIAS